ncbi:SDR family NAD(P)-dependent oxidoreductase [Nonomuraea aridisoli]|uniref:Short-chain dehydrogenase n=1 Tax=Nonomuraea aridisoli TaxID=2070368 RepID=A0A2W2EJW9_9ACTN|nr:SDR family NAD(P)-dependent oxidoreductase [Nonomuraea aridisoli]PZG17229.1 short-chain dehydrogenase [Nonomuraea aridisoli]
MARARWTAHDVPDQQGRVAVITGANTGIGFETARVLAGCGASVIMAVRDADRGKRAAARIAADVSGADVSVLRLDLASLASIRSAAEELHATRSGIDLLINNAGVMYTPYGTTADGFELQIGVNHLGHFALTGLLLDMMLPVPGSRVVTVASAAHRQAGTMNLDDLNWRHETYDRTAAYGRSKLANLMFTYDLQRRLSGRSQTIAVAAHPGGSDTGGSRRAVSGSSRLHRAVFAVVRPLLIQPAHMGALPTLRAAVDPSVQGGQYYGPDGLAESRGHPKVVRSTARSHDQAAQRRLWSVSEELTGVTFPL